MLGVLVGSGVALVAAPAHAAAAVTGLGTAVVSATHERIAAVVATEDLRLRQIQRDPYPRGGAAGNTLVLPPRPSSYAVADIQRLAPGKLVRMKDGSYLLSQSIAVMPGATLRLSAPQGGLTLRLSSGPAGFVSIVSLGGNLDLVGQAKGHFRLSSWDVGANTPDTAPEDGRAYVRTIDGRFTADYVDASALGFWSGRTGGLALTGTALPIPAPLLRTDQAGGDTVKHSVVGRVLASWATSILSMGFIGDGIPDPAGPLQLGQKGPNPDYIVPAPSRVSDRITHTSVTGDAFGLFISGTNGLSISDTNVKESLISGVVLHRDVTSGVLSRTSSNDNAGDGFLLDRATTGITLNQTTANNNAGSGFAVSGVPEADGPSAAGASTISYGGNLIANSTASSNGTYGIHIVGGSPVGVQNNRVTDTDMGIVVTGPAQRVSIIGNEVTNVRRHGIALMDGVSVSTVTGNTVDNAGTGIYVRDSIGQVKRNTIARAEVHGVSLVGRVAGSDVAVNVVAGSGPSALDSTRSSGTVTFSRNQVSGWEEDEGPWYLWFEKLLHPMTFLWLMIALLVTTTAVRSRKERPTVHPYAHQMAHHGHLSMPGHAPKAQSQAPKVTDPSSSVGRHRHEPSGLPS